MQRLLLIVLTRVLPICVFLLIGITSAEAAPIGIDFSFGSPDDYVSGSLIVDDNSADALADVTLTHVATDISSVLLALGCQGCAAGLPVVPFSNPPSSSLINQWTTLNGQIVSGDYNYQDILAGGVFTFGLSIDPSGSFGGMSAGCCLGFFFGSASGPLAVSPPGNVVPEPTSLLLVATGGFGLLIKRRRALRFRTQHPSSSPHDRLRP